MENPNIHNIPYARSRDQKRWKDHSKKVSSRAETTERMRKWRAENRDKNKRNDLRCRVYRLARQKYGEEDTEEKLQFINEEINRRLDRRMLLDDESIKPPIASSTTSEQLNELPFYCAPLHKIELPSIHIKREKSNNTNSQPPSPMSDALEEYHHPNTNNNNERCSSTTTIHSTNTSNSPQLPPMQSFLTTLQQQPPH